MARRRRTHTALFDRCVKDVTREGSAKNPDAVCQATLGRRALLSRGLSGTSRRTSRRRVNPRMFVIKARRDDHPELTYTGEKFERGGTPVKFPTEALARTWLRHLRTAFSVELRRYRLRVAPL